MSYTFEHHDREIWSPNHCVASLFLSQVHYIEQAINVPSGLDEYMSDTVEVDFHLLTAFLEKLGEWANYRHSSMPMLLKGVIVHLLALRLFGDLPVSAGKHPREWLEEAHELARLWGLSGTAP